MRSQLRFVMHADDELQFERELLAESHLQFIDGPRWPDASPKTFRTLARVGHHCLLWSPLDLANLSADEVGPGAWCCRSGQATIQFLRSEQCDTFLTEGRIAINTEASAPFEPGGAAALDKRYKRLRTSIKKTYANNLVHWFNPTSVAAPASKERSANPSKADEQVWLGPHALAWLQQDDQRRIKQFRQSVVVGLLDVSALHSER
jgi:hypothetical protein